MTQSILERQVHYANSYRKLWDQAIKDKPCPPVSATATWVTGRIVRSVEVQSSSQMKRAKTLFDLIDEQIEREERK